MATQITMAVFRARLTVRQERRIEREAAAATQAGDHEKARELYALVGIPYTYFPAIVVS